MAINLPRTLMIAGAAWLAGRALIRYRRRFEFGGRTVLIAGGSRGLGLLLARRLVAEGARVAICARDPEELARAERDLRERGGGEAWALACDVADPRQVHDMVRQVNERWGAVDVLFNVAGIIQVGPLQEMTEADFAQAIDVHFWGPLHTTRAVLPGMRARGQGRIVNITSIGGVLSVPHMIPYSASKFALVGLSEGLRAELLHEGIKVTTVVPGLMRTGSAPNAEFKGRHEAEFAWFSISASAPVLAMNADRAARQILEACRRGQAHLVLSMPAKLGMLVHALAPGMTANALGLVNRWLPAPGGIGTRTAKGAESRPRWQPGWTTALGDRAARRNNELGASASPPR